MPSQRVDSLLSRSSPSIGPAQKDDWKFATAIFFIWGMVAYGGGFGYFIQWMSGKEPLLDRLFLKAVFYLLMSLTIFVGTCTWKIIQFIDKD